MTEKQQNILIIGAGLCGSLLALRLGQRGYNVTVYEMRPDLRTTDISAGRSINLAFSDRGNKAMKMVGIEDKVAIAGNFATLIEHENRGIEVKGCTRGLADIPAQTNKSGLQTRSDFIKGDPLSLFE